MTIPAPKAARIVNAPTATAVISPAPSLVSREGVGEHLISAFPIRLEWLNPGDGDGPVPRDLAAVPAPQVFKIIEDIPTFEVPGLPGLRDGFDADSCEVADSSASGSSG
jgi:hypothetical protein